MFQTVKPRAYWSELAQKWVVHGAGMLAFASTLDGALELWRGCYLAEVCA
jgi:hypothetical protein